MKIEPIFKEFVNEVVKSVKLACVLQIGSSVYDKKSKDIDLVFVSAERIFSGRDHTKIFELAHKYMQTYPGVGFNIGGEEFSDAEYQISLVLINLIEIEDQTKAYDLFFIKGLSEDKNKKVIYGSDLTNSIKIEIDKNYLIQYLLRSIEHFSRKLLNPAYDVEVLRAFFKEILRFMLSNCSVRKKEDLLKAFIENYPKIKLPKNTEEILAGKVKRTDLQDVLRFAEDCLQYLLK